MDISNKMLNPALWPTRNYSATTLIQIKLILICIMVSTVIAAEYELKVNYDIGHYKLLHINQTLEIICKNLLNRNPPSWTYSSRLYRDPRMKLSQNIEESSLVINNAQAEDAGQYECSIDHEYNGRTFHFHRTIEVIVNEIKEVKEEEEKKYIKLLCDVYAYPSATVIWKIVYDNEALNPQPEDLGEDEYWIPPEEKVVVDKSEGRWTLRPYKGVNNAELIIADVTENDDGKYYCVAKSIAGDQCKDCTVKVKRKATGTGKSSADLFDLNAVELKDEKNANSGILKAADQETENTQEVEGLGGGTITIIVLSSFFVLDFVLGTLILFRWMKLQKKKEEEMQKEGQNGRSSPLIDCNDALKV